MRYRGLVLMSKKTLTCKVPKLRFPEFRDAGEWGWNVLGKHLNQHPKYGINAPAVPFSKKLPTYLRITDISEDGRFLYNDKVSVNSNVSDENYLHEGDIVLARTGASVGKSYKYRPEDGKLVFAGFLIRVRPNPKKLVTGFLSQFLFTEQYWHWVSITSPRGGQPGINGNEYASLSIPIPPKIQEQQKIADCLSSVDELINAQSQKLEALKAHKKALMQGLFPQEGKKVPQLRFPEFLDAGEWEKIELIDTTDKEIKWSFIGGPFGSNLKSSDYVTSGIRVIQLQNIGDSEFIDDYKIYTSEEKANELLSNNIFPGDIIMSKMGDPVGRACLIPEGEERYVMCSDGIRLAINEKKYDKYFIYSLINHNSFRSVIERTATGSTRKRIGLDVLKKLPMYVPKELKEQQKIADCLSSLDQLINAHSQKLEALKAHKKGLMQQLFPSNDEVCE